MKRVGTLASVLLVFGSVLTACTNEPGATTTRPVVTITSPSSGSAIDALETFTASGTATASLPLAEVQVGFAGAESVEATLEGNVWTATLTAPTEGDHTIVATATDSSGNSGEDEVGVSVGPVIGSATGALERVPALGSGRPSAPSTDAEVGGFAAELMASGSTRESPVAFDHPALPAPNRIIVTFRDIGMVAMDVSSGRQLTGWRTAVDELATDYGALGLLSGHGALPTSGIAVYDVAQDADVGALIASLSRDPRVRSVERDSWVFSTALPGAPLFPLQWAHDLTDAQVAWEVSTDAPAVRVAVVDTGSAGPIGLESGVGAHPDLLPNLIAGFDFVSHIDLADGVVAPSAAFDAIKSRFPQAQYLDGDLHEGYDPYPVDELNTIMNPATGEIEGLDDFGSHGTHVAGIIGAAAAEGAAVAGVAWNVEIQPIRVLGHAGFGTNVDVLNGVAYAAGLPVVDPVTEEVYENPTPAHIINMSLGGGAFSEAAAALYSQVRDMGVLVVASAGNASSSLEHYPSSYDGVLSVSSVDYIHWVEERGGPAIAFTDFFSNSGRTVDIAAPGGISWLDVEAYESWDLSRLTSGMFILSTGWEWFDSTSPDAEETNQPGYFFAAGTSMSAPYVAGAAALLLGLDPELTADDLEAILTGTATRVDDSFLTYAYGRPDAEWDPHYGHGALNLPAAVAAVQSGEIRRLPATTYVEAVSTSDPARVVRVEANPDYSFEIPRLPAGEWQLRAGVDVNGNGQIGDGGEYFGVFDTPVVVDSTRTVTGDVSFILERSE